MALVKAFFLSLVSLHLSGVSCYPSPLPGNLTEILPENFTSMVTDTADKSLSLFNQIYDNANTIFNGILGFGNKVDKVLQNTYYGPPYFGKKRSPAMDLGNKIDNLMDEADKEFRDGSYKVGMEMDTRRAIKDGQDYVLGWLKFLTVKANDISQGIADLADESKDLQKKSKPLVDTIVKFNEVVESPEFRSISSLFEVDEVCKWSIGREREVTYGFFVDKEYVRCRLRKNGGDTSDENLIYDLVNMNKLLPGGTYEDARIYLSEFLSRHQYFI